MRVKLNQWQKQDSTSDCRDLQGLQIMPLPVSPQQDGLKKMPREGTVGLPQGALELPPPWGNTFMYTPPGSLWKAAHGKMSSTFSYHFKCYDAHFIFIMLCFLKWLIVFSVPMGTKYGQNQGSDQRQKIILSQWGETFCFLELLLK